MSDIKWVRLWDLTIEDLVKLKQETPKTHRNYPLISGTLFWRIYMSNDAVKEQLVKNICIATEVDLVQRTKDAYPALAKLMYDGRGDGTSSIPENDSNQ